MKLIIDISENLYKATVNGLDANEIWDLRLSVKNGIPLDKIRNELDEYDDTDLIKVKYVRQIIDKYRNEVSK